MGYRLGGNPILQGGIRSSPFWLLGQGQVAVGGKFSPLSQPREWRRVDALMVIASGAKFVMVPAFSLSAGVEMIGSGPRQRQAPPSPFYDCAAGAVDRSRAIGERTPHSSELDGTNVPSVRGPANMALPVPF